MSTTTQTTWTWNEAPFSTKLDAKRFFAASSQEEALSRIHFLVENQRRLGVLTGPAGCGKSMVLEVCAKQLAQQNCQVAIISLVGMQPDEFLWRLAVALGTNPRVEASSRQLWRLIEDHIRASRYQRVTNVLLLDDVEEAENDVLTILARLAQIDTNDDSRLTLLLTCADAKIHLLGERLQQLCDLTIEVEPWSSEETTEFLNSSLTSAACEPGLFEEDTNGRLHELSGGVPRRIQQLAQLALVAAAGEDLESIDVATLEAVYDELILPASRSAWA